MSKEETPWTVSEKKKTLVKAEAEGEAETKVIFKKLTTIAPAKFLKIAEHGQPKSGKTRFALTAPGPIYVIATEPGLAPLVPLFPDKEIYFVDVYEVDPTGIFEVEPTKTLAKIDDAVRQIRAMVQKDPKSVGTVVFDSVTDLWKWVQEWMKTEILKIDKTARVRQQWDWGYANSKYQNIIMQLLSLPCHLILTAQDKELYSGPGERSGIYEARWMNQTPYWVDIVIGLVKMKSPQTGGIQYVANIEDSRHMDDELHPIAGESFTDDAINFEELQKLLSKHKKEAS